MNDSILVTGAAGFVGSAVIRELVAQKEQLPSSDKDFTITAMVRKESLVPSFLKQQPLKIVEADITSPSDLEHAFNGITKIIHIAAVFRQAKFSDSYYFSVNRDGTRNVFTVAAKMGVKRVIHCSTTGVISHVKNPPADETAPYAPTDVYQVSKKEAEELALDFYRRGEMGGVVIRPAMIYGPSDTRFLKMFRLIARRRFFYVGSGEALVHWIDVRDLARAFVMAVFRDDLNGAIYTIGGDRWRTLKESVNEIAQQLNVSEPKLHLPVKLVQMMGSGCEALCRPFGIEPPIYRRRVDFFIKNRAFNTIKAETELGFKPTQTFSEEIKDIISSYRQSNLL
jgi:nucleoside-diphosphate-sugar epimerase